MKDSLSTFLIIFVFCALNWILGYKAGKDSK